MMHAHTGAMRYVPLIARILLSAMFLMSGFNKIVNFTGTAGFIESVGLPAGALLTIVAIVLELVGGVLLLIGWQGRVGAWLLILFTVVATVLFHNNLADQQQMILALKNIAVIGGLLMVVAYGTGPLSVGCRCGGKRCPECKGKGSEAQGAPDMMNDNG